ncbi:MAG: acetyl-CoA carboxylase biotin carboxylase subunit, partial [Candidatus Omnitrophica bacterium]|nr:acetyl-CoA carboxylase biotin carboxylase subunit [Candidatus Omnitrophota bacterium]
YIEKYIEEPRHIEFQILADNSGRILHLGERDCSVQRRYQKLIEEAPSPGLDPKLRKKMGEMAVKGARQVDFVSAGTMEFLVDKHKNFYFMEMNTRIQVEHPVTELVTGIDIVKEQIKIAAGGKLSFRQEDIRINGWAVECRINAEDYKNNFIPSPGRIDTYIAPGGPNLRLDTHVYPGYTIPPYYDSMMAKLIAHGPDRISAIKTMQRGLEEFIIEPLNTTLDFHKIVLNDPVFLKGQADTHFIERLLGESE